MALPTYTTTYAAVQALQDAFYDYWTALPVRCHVVFDNVGDDPVANTRPVVSNDPVVSGEAVLVLQITHTDGGIAALGTRRFRMGGLIAGRLFVETGRGRVRTSGKLGDSVLAFLQTHNVPGFVFSDQRLSEVGVSGRWWQVNIVANFQYDIVRT